MPVGVQGPLTVKPGKVRHRPPGARSALVANAGQQPPHPEDSDVTVYTAQGRPIQMIDRHTRVRRSL